MNKTDFIANIAAKAESSKAQAAVHLDAVLATITEIFQNNDTLILPGFGTFGVKKRAARSGRNPSTGKTLNIPEANVAFVRVSSKIKELLNPESTKKAVKPAQKKVQQGSLVE